MKRAVIVSAWVVAALAVVVTAASVYLFVPDVIENSLNPRRDLDPAARDSSVATIMKSLHENSEDQFASLESPDLPDPKKEIRKGLEQWAYVSDKSYAISYSPILTPYQTMVDINTVDKESNPVHFRFSLDWYKGQWRLSNMYTSTDYSATFSPPTPVPAQPPPY